jgi:glycosyltransferase involved in cell wall biosynthesis
LSLEEKKRLINIINKNKKRIIHHNELPNEEVLELMKTSAHVGLLPTHADTYGYSVLEFQASGCPVISTNLRALSEINNEDCGWLIDVSKSSLKEAFSNTSDELFEIQNTVEKKLEAIFIEILTKPEVIEKKGKKSLKRIELEHSPKEFSKKIKELYYR